MDQEHSIQSLSDRIDEYLFRERAILIFISSLLLAVLLASLVSITPLTAVLFVLISFALFLAERVWNKRVRREVFFLCITLLAFGLGILRYDIKDFHIPDQVLLASVDEEIEITGVVVSEPEERDNLTRIIVETGSEKVLVNAELYSKAGYGDEIVARGTLTRPGIIDDGVGRPFDYAEYLAKDDIYYVLSFAETEVVSSGHGHPVKSALFSVKRNFVKKIRGVFAEPYASLLAGLIVAGKDSMPKDILDEFRRAGVVHIVVLSGYNITIIAEFMRKMFENLFLWIRIGSRPRTAAGASILGIILFVLMTGAEPTVVRASLMVLAVIVAKLFGRNYSASRALLVVAFLMILHNPKILVFDPSFQLSFMATLALIYVVPIVESYMNWLTDKWGVRVMVATTVSTQVVVLPYLIYSMGEVSLVSLPANILILLFIPATMLLGFVATLVSYVSSIIALPFAYISHLFLSWILGVSAVLGNIPLASLGVPSFSVWLAIIAYVAMITLVWLWRNSLQLRSS